MIPVSGTITGYAKPFPRTRGDDPLASSAKERDGDFSPHPRG